MHASLVIGTQPLYHTVCESPRSAFGEFQLIPIIYEWRPPRRNITSSDPYSSQPLPLLQILPFGNRNPSNSNPSNPYPWNSYCSNPNPANPEPWNPAHNATPANAGSTSSVRRQRWHRSEANENQTQNTTFNTRMCEKNPARHAQNEASKTIATKRMTISAPCLGIETQQR